MANTTNFNWETPDDTDLVKDGAAAIRTLGSAIDTSLVDLKGGTTGQILAKATNTDMDFSWITNDVGDITAVNVTSPITGGGTSGAVTVSIQDGTTAQKGAVQLENSTSSTSTTTAAVPASVKSAYDLADGAIAKSIVDAKGDLIVATADNTVARLAVGATNGHTLQVDSSTATGVKWAAATSTSGLTLVKTQTIGTSVTSVAVTSAFSSTYDNYFITVNGGTNTGHGNIKLQLGATTSTYHIGGNYMSYSSTTINGYVATNDSNWYAGKHSPDDNFLQVFLHNPNLAKITEFTARAVGGNNASGGITNYQGFLNNTTQYTDFTLLFDSASTGGTIRVYGFQNS